MLHSSFLAAPARPEPTGAEMDGARRVRPLVISSQGNDLLRAPFPKCVSFGHGSYCPSIASPRKRRQQRDRLAASLLRILLDSRATVAQNEFGRATLLTISARLCARVGLVLDDLETLSLLPTCYVSTHPGSCRNGIQIQSSSKVL